MLIICHYAEIALKGGNRKFFEEKLIENIKKSLKAQGIVFKLAKRISGRILLELPDGQEKEKIALALQSVFGIAYFYFAESCRQDIEQIKRKSVDVLGGKDFKTFRVEAKRADKRFSFSSQQINERVGKAIVEELRKKVKLNQPDVTLFIDIVERYCFLYTEKISGPGGLPLRVSGKAVSLISGGIDSPVASFLLMKRGVENIFVHFYANQQGYQKSLEKVRDILKVLKKFQDEIKVYFAPFGEIQKEIVLKCQADLRVVLYRRFMFLVASEIAKKENAKALITGESVGQVASQTLDNMLAVEEAVDLPVMRPLSGMDKQEIIGIAKKIGTYEISILPHLDCCSMFVPDHPATKANLKEVKKEEKKLKVAKLIQQAIKNTKIETI